MDFVQTLKQLCAIPSLSGQEQAKAERLAQMLTPYCDTVSVDPFFNVVGVRKSAQKDAKTLLLDAHLDQIGFVVTDVLEGGFLRFTSIGGVDPRMLLGREVRILTEPPLYGVIASVPPHLQASGEESKSVPMHEMLLDTGLQDAKSVIPIGTPIVFREEVVQLSEDSVTGPMLDDMAGIVSILYALERLKRVSLPVHLMVQFTAQEETTSLGARVSTWKLQPDYAIAVDVTHARTPDASPDKAFPYGGGTFVGMGPNLHTKFTKRILEIAKRERIPHGIEVMEGHTGTNAWGMQVAGCGTRMALLSIPLRYMHTPIESVKLQDIKATGDLLAHVCQNGTQEEGTC